MDNEKQLAALREKEQVRILALESSCDETAAAVIENGRRILSNVVFSQIDLHALYGGVVPEIASRAHVEACDRVVDQALEQAGMTLQEVDACAVTYGPGLVGRAAYRGELHEGPELCRRQAADPRQPY